ncbi:hypothetical protein N9K84_06690, partial [Candidatus Poseidoniales archaeon]|nr:hypothetical protein [Candidatus Poseidoniales archaeon]
IRVQAKWHLIRFDMQSNGTNASEQLESLAMVMWATKQECRQWCKTKDQNAPDYQTFQQCMRFKPLVGEAERGYVSSLK